MSERHPSQPVSPETLAIMGISPELLHASTLIIEQLTNERNLRIPTTDTLLTSYDRTVRDWDAQKTTRSRIENLLTDYPRERIDDQLYHIEIGLAFATTLPFSAAAIDADRKSNYFGGAINQIVAETPIPEANFLIPYMQAHHTCYVKILGKSLDFLSCALLFHRYGEIERKERIAILGNTTNEQLSTIALLQRYKAERLIQGASAEEDDTILGIKSLYSRWKRQAEVDPDALPDLHGSGFHRNVTKPQQPEVIQTMQQGPSAEEIASHTGAFAAAHNAYARLASDYHSTTRQLDKEGFRPLTTAILRELRDTQSELITSEPEDAAHAKRIIGTLRRLAIYGGESDEQLTAQVMHLIPTEQALYEQLRDRQSTLAAIGHGENTILPPSLDADLRWINTHWRHLKPHIQAQWPQQRGAHAAVSITAFLKEFRDVHLSHDQDPRRKLYAIARHVGRAALPPETKEAPDVPQTPVFKIESANALQGLKTIQQQANDMHVRQRATVIMHFLDKATQLAKTTGAEKYGLYFADNARDVRNRYFIVRTQDETGRDWFILETLEAERATYIVPVELLHEMQDDLGSADAELEAVLEYNKAMVRELGQLAALRNQVSHTHGWDVGSHIASVERRMSTYRGVTSSQ